jgi:hypothetical protein
MVIFPNFAIQFVAFVIKFFNGACKTRDLQKESYSAIRVCSAKLFSRHFSLSQKRDKEIVLAMLSL